MIDKLLHAVTLTAKGRDPQQAVVVQQTRIQQALIFGFERSALPITVADKDLTLTLKLGMVNAKAKFDPKDMVYEGKIAL